MWSNEIPSLFNTTCTTTAETTFSTEHDNDTNPVQSPPMSPVRVTRLNEILERDFDRLSSEHKRDSQFVSLINTEQRLNKIEEHCDILFNVNKTLKVMVETKDEELQIANDKNKLLSKELSELRDDHGDMKQHYEEELEHQKRLFRNTLSTLLLHNSRVERWVYAVKEKRKFNDSDLDQITTLNKKDKNMICKQ
jgi:septal ring factor EnvC (AmiA/AmiB activator)